MLEDCDHIFFTCHLAKFMWAGVRELHPCNWNPTGVVEFIAIVQGLSGPLRRLAWFAFAALGRTLWNTRNKLAIEGKVIGHPANVLFTMSIHMQSWRVLIRQRDRDLLDEALGELRRLYARIRMEGT
jgi:hypothetical protein